MSKDSGENLLAYHKDSGVNLLAYHTPFLSQSMRSRFYSRIEIVDTVEGELQVCHHMQFSGDHGSPSLPKFDAIKRSPSALGGYELSNSG